MGNTFTLPLGDYPTGVYQIPQVATPQGLGGCKLTIPRCTSATPTIWPSSATRLSVSLDLSFDGGATWHNGLFRLDAAGGIMTELHSGLEVPNVTATFVHEPMPTHVRGSMEIKNGPLRSSLTFTTK